MATSTIKGTTRDQIENEKWIACEFKNNTYTYSVGSENFESDASFKMFKDINMNISSLWLDRKNYYHFLNYQGHFLLLFALMRVILCKQFNNLWFCFRIWKKQIRIHTIDLTKLVLASKTFDDIVGNLLPWYSTSANPNIVRTLSDQLRLNTHLILEDRLTALQSSLPSLILYTIIN